MVTKRKRDRIRASGKKAAEFFHPRRRWPVYLTLGLIVAGILVWMAPRINRRFFNVTDPYIVKSGADELPLPRERNMLRVWAIVENRGKNGYVALEVTLRFKGEKYFRSSVNRVKHKKRAKISILFDDVIFKDRDPIPEFSVEVHPE